MTGVGTTDLPQAGRSGAVPGAMLYTVNAIGCSENREELGWSGR